MGKELPGYLWRSTPALADLYDHRVNHHLWRGDLLHSMDMDERGLDSESLEFGVTPKHDTLTLDKKPIKQEIVNVVQIRGSRKVLCVMQHISYNTIVDP